MSDDWKAQLETEIEKLQRLRGVAVLEQIERIVALADSHHDGETAAVWRRNMLQVGSHQGRLDYELKGLSGLRQQYATDPAMTDLRGPILWYFKWIGSRLADYVELSADTIERTLDEMEAFYRAENENMRPVHSVRRGAAVMMGRDEEATKYDQLWQDTPEGESDDCRACSTDNRVHFLLAVNRIDDAINEAEPILRSEQHCAEVPALTFSRLLMPYLFRSDSEICEAMHRMTIRQVRKTPGLLNSLASHITYLSFTGRAQHAKRLAFVALSRAAVATNSYHRFTVLRSCSLWLSMLAREGVATVPLPKAYFPDAVGPTDVPEAAAKCLADARDLAVAFDARNGTGKFVESMEMVEKFMRLPIDDDSTRR